MQARRTIADVPARCRCRPRRRSVAPTEAVPAISDAEDDQDDAERRRHEARGPCASGFRRDSSARSPRRPARTGSSTRRRRNRGGNGKREQKGSARGERVARPRVPPARHRGLVCKNFLILVVAFAPTPALVSDGTSSAQSLKRQRAQPALGTREAPAPIIKRNSHSDRQREPCRARGHPSRRIAERCHQAALRADRWRCSSG